MSTTAERGPGLQEQARRIYLDSVAAGRPVTPAELAAGLGRSTRWAQQRIREADTQTPPTPTRTPTAANPVPDAQAGAPRNFAAAGREETPVVAVADTGLPAPDATTGTPRNFAGAQHDPPRNFAREDTGTREISRNFARNTVPDQGMYISGELATDPGNFAPVPDAQAGAPRNFAGDDAPAARNFARNFAGAGREETPVVAVADTGLPGPGPVRNVAGGIREETSAVQTAAVGWARLGFWLGLVVSVGANMLHAAQPDTTSPAAGAVSWAEIGAAAVWPVFLLISIEILTRTAWPGTAWPRLARWLGTVAVAVVAGAESYWHMRALLLSWGEHVLLASAGPLAVDGLMLLAATSLLVSATTRKAEQR